MGVGGGRLGKEGMVDDRSLITYHKNRKSQLPLMESKSANVDNYLKGSLWLTDMFFTGLFISISLCVCVVGCVFKLLPVRTIWRIFRTL